MTATGARRGRGLAWLLAAALLVGAAAGCGQGTTTAEGKVTHRGKPVVWGHVALRSGVDDKVYIGEIQPTGAYRVEGVPVGPVKIGVLSPDPEKPPSRDEARRQKEGGRQKPPKGAWFPLPRGADDPLASGLTGEVVAGKPLDIDVP